MTDRKRKNEYVGIKTKAARGDYELVVPFDLFILEHLPEVGTLFAGMYPLGETVANIQKTLNKTSKDVQLQTGEVFGRMRSLEIQGLVVHTKGTKSKRVWQRTESGSKVFKEWKEKQRGTTNNS